MSPHAIYRLGIWLPIAIPAAIAGIVHGLDVSVDTPALRKIVQIALMSLLYGGIPYALLALWGTWWVGGRPEEEIRRMMFRAPLVMVGVFFVLCLVAGVAVGRPMVFATVGLFGALFIIPLGYAYVTLVLVLRAYLGPGAS